MSNPHSFSNPHQQQHHRPSMMQPGQDPNMQRFRPPLPRAPFHPIQNEIMSSRHQFGTPAPPSPFPPRPAGQMVCPPPFAPPSFTPQPQGIVAARPLQSNSAVPVPPLQPNSALAAPPLQPNFNFTTPPPFAYPRSGNNNTHLRQPQHQPQAPPPMNKSFLPVQRPPLQSQQGPISSQQPAYTNLGTDVKTLHDETTMECDKDRQEGKRRILTWLQRAGKTMKPSDSEKPRQKQKDVQCNINNYLCSLQRMNELIARMTNQIELLESTLSTADKASWTEDCLSLDQTKEQFIKMEKLLQKTPMSVVEKKLHKIKQKRARIKRLRQTQRDEDARTLELRQVKERQISKWQKEIEEAMKEEKLKKERKIKMDSTLAEVTKKIQDADRLIETMSAIEKLRLIRRDAAEKRGESSLGESRESVSEKVEDMKRLVKGQLEVYREEEQVLKNTIKAEYEKSTKKEKQKQLEKDEAKKRKEESDLQSILFGHFDEVGVSDPLYPFQEFYQQASKSLPNLLQTRFDWDHFITSNELGTALPNDWVFPTKPSSDAWASALVQD